MKWINIAMRLFRQYQSFQRQGDRLGGKRTKKTKPPTRAVEQGVTIEYSPDMDGDADPGEVVWAWVPYEDDPNQGKDRPVVIIGRSGGDLAGVMLTSKNKGRSEYIAVGTGKWDPKGRDSWAKADRLLLIDSDDVRREGAVLPRDRFDDVVKKVSTYHDLARR